jgi:hypothetical protein
MAKFAGGTPKIRWRPFPCMISRNQHRRDSVGIFKTVHFLKNRKKRFVIDGFANIAFPVEI